MIITGGYNVYSAEVENALAAYPDILARSRVLSPRRGHRASVAVITPARAHMTSRSAQFRRVPTERL